MFVMLMSSTGEGTVHERVRGRRRKSKREAQALEISNRLPKASNGIDGEGLVGEEGQKDRC